MRKLFLSALGIVLFALSTLAAERSLMQLTLVSGEKVVISGMVRWEISSAFDPQSQTFKFVVNNEVSYEFSELKEVHFFDDPESVEHPENVVGKLSFHLYDKQVVVSGENLSGIRAYTIDGKVAPVSIERGSDAVTVDFSACAPGIYIVKTNINSIKVSIR